MVDLPIYILPPLPIRPAQLVMKIIHRCAYWLSGALAFLRRLLRMGTMRSTPYPLDELHKQLNQLASGGFSIQFFQ